MSNVIQTLRERGLLENITDPGLEKLAETEPLVVYNGLDPTADSLHIGNLMALQILSHFQRAGHRPIALVGGATGLIGDPSGKKGERDLLSREQVAANVEGIRKVLGHLFSFEGENAAILANNIDWFGEFTFLDVIRDVGKHIRITEMLARDSVKARLDSGAGLSFTEFSYQILQAYDFYHLFKEQGCRVQVGGADQWGNITAGTDLIRRLTGEQAYGLVCPLLLDSAGNKFGKSEGGAVWLSADRTSPYQFYQFWIRAEDSDAIRLLKAFTFLPLEEIAELEMKVSEEPEKREAQKRLAWEMTVRIHGEEAAHSAIAATQALFGGDLEGLDLRTLEDVFAEVPSFAVGKDRIEAGVPILDALVESQMASSKGEARRLINGGGVYLNNERLESDSLSLKREHLLHDRLFVLRSGKKKYCLGRVE
jgi:tyrosyl-tRNA synthetase